MDEMKETTLRTIQETDHGITKKAIKDTKLGFIGAGKVGCSLGKFFAESGITVTGYYSLHQESAKEAAEFTGTKSYVTIEQIVNESDALFLTVPDSEISSVFQSIKGMHITGKQICHCSGALSAEEAFPGIEKAGANGYSIHPLFPISSKLNSYRELSGAFFCLEGEGPDLMNWKMLLEGLGPRVQIISKESKIKYHAGCAMASNLVCALLQESVDLLVASGFDEKMALQALTPLIQSNIKHVLEAGPTQALTGPMERGDVSTVEKHLQNMDTSAEKEMYRAVSEKLLEMAKKRHPERDFTEMEEALRK